MLEKMIQNILDIPKAEGVCLLTLDGRPAVVRMPAYIPAQVYDDLVRRVTALYETMDENFIPCDDYLLKYPGKWLYLRRSEACLMILLLEEGANVMSLKMVSNMALKGITREQVATLHPTALADPKKPEAPPAPAAAAGLAPAAVKVGAPAEGPPKAEETPPQTPERAPGRIPRSEKPARTYRGTLY